ncbi:DNA polymerase III subunit delta [Mycoplasma sp. 773]
MYLIKGNENFLINKKINEIINKEKTIEVGDIEIVKFYDFFTLEELSDALNNNSLFLNKKIILFKNPFIFNIKNKYANSLCIDEFIKIINASLSDANLILIFTQEINKYDKSFLASRAFAFINDNSTTINIEKISDKELFSFVYKMIKTKGGTIKDKVLIDLLSMLPHNLEIIESEIDKLLLINKDISEKMINDNNYAVSNNIDFALSEAMLKCQDTKTIIKKINEQISYGIEHNYVISQISAILLNAKTIGILKSIKLTNDEIAKMLNIHIYRVKLHYDFFNRIDINTLNQLIIDLANIDLDFKKGNILPDTLIDLLSIKLLRLRIY